MLDTLSPRGLWAGPDLAGDLESAAPSAPLTVSGLRALLGPYDELLADAGSDTSMVVSIALTRNNKSHTYDYGHAQAAWWATRIFDINRRHCALHRIPLVLRVAPAVHSRQQLETCQSTPGHMKRRKCMRDLHRQASTWGKMLMMRDMLRLPGVAYVLCLDADAVFAHTGRDTVRHFVRLLEATPGKELLVANEDWRRQGKGTLNTGMMFARSTNFTRVLFGSLVLSFEAGMGGPEYRGPGRTCAFNEQICLTLWWTRAEFPGLRTRLLAVSSVGPNFSPCVWFWCPDVFPAADRKHACHACNKAEARCLKACELQLGDPQIEVIHFMGDSRPFVDVVMPLLPQP